MSKYSLQIECLENIEAFSDEQFTAEMSVIESVLEIFDKTITMMELSNSDINIPNCSMFMESTFFQELDTNTSQPDAQSQSGGETNPAPTDNNTSTGNNTDNQNQKPAMTEEERKAHNKEHWVRQINKKGNVENIFISIIAFIPRFFLFLGRCVKKLFSKTNDKAKDAACEKADGNMQNMTNEEITEAVNNANNKGQPDSQPQQPNPQQSQQEQTDNIGTLNIDSRNWMWYNTNNVVAGIRKCMETLTKMQNNVDDILNNRTSDLKNQIDSCQAIIKNSISSEKLMQMSGSDVVKSKNTITDQLNRFGRLCEDLAKTFDSKKDMFLKFFESNTDKNTKINEVKQSCYALKDFSKMISNNLDRVYKSYDRMVRTAIAINNVADSKNNNNDGGENNGQQKQVNNTQ